MLATLPRRRHETQSFSWAGFGRYRPAGTFSTEDLSPAVAEEPERHAAKVAVGAAGGLERSPLPPANGSPELIQVGVLTGCRPVKGGDQLGVGCGA